MGLVHFFLRRLVAPRRPRSPHRPLPGRARTLPYLECLEGRLAPATLVINNPLGTLVYQAGAGVNNAFSLTGNAMTYTFQDSAEPITLAGGTAGWTVVP